MDNQAVVAIKPSTEAVAQQHLWEMGRDVWHNEAAPMLDLSSTQPSSSTGRGCEEIFPSLHLSFFFFLSYNAFFSSSWVVCMKACIICFDSDILQCMQR